MKTIEFDIKKAKSGLYDIIDTDGNSVRIICWDYPVITYPLIGLYSKQPDFEFLDYYDEHGQSYTFSERRLMLVRKTPNQRAAERPGAKACVPDVQQSPTMPNMKEVYYDGLEKRNDYDVICEHITDTKLSDMVNTRLNNCGWFVCDKNTVRQLIDSITEIERNL